MKIVKAQRQKVKLKIGITGSAGSGKTLSALYLAEGLTNGDWDKICVIDTENCRSLSYASRSDLKTKEFLHLNLEPPFTVERYVEAMKMAEEAVGENGVVIIDSASAEWAGTDGILETKDKMSNGSKSINAWNGATKLHNKFLDTLLGLNCHVIATMRSKTAYEIEKNEETGKTTMKKVGLAPVQREGFDYELSLVFDIDQNTHFASVKKDVTILDAEGFCGKITPEVGERLRKWVEEGHEPEIHKCACCGQAIKPYRFDDDTIMGINEIVENSKATYGAEMCMDCCIAKSQEATEEVPFEEQ